MTTEDDLYWARVNAALDERRDPRADAHVLERLACDGAARDEVARLTRVLLALEREGATAAPVPPRWTRYLAPLAAGLLGLAGLWRFAAGADPAGSLPPHGPSAEVLRLELTVVHEHADGRSTVQFTPERLLRADERHYAGEVSASITTTTTATLRPH
ncbi:MAG: hypothetical protein H6828_05415 [Planctomycetes bacterium]|nr:hypothetical protein [Planctomycetota bacterium]